MPFCIEEADKPTYTPPIDNSRRNTWCHIWAKKKIVTLTSDHLRKDGMINNQCKHEETLMAIQTTINELCQQNEYIKTQVQ
jgi:hypothetical protein